MGLQRAAREREHQKNLLDKMKIKEVQGRPLNHKREAQVKEEVPSQRRKNP